LRISVVATPGTDTEHLAVGRYLIKGTALATDVHGFHGAVITTPRNRHY
jgi:hypothetical protein